jgi:hypothetical protein
MIKLKNILAEALPDVPMTVGFNPSEDYQKQIPAEFRRFYNNEGGNKTGRFIEMAEQLVKVYGPEVIQQDLEKIDDTSNEIQSYLDNQNSPYSTKSPRNPGANESIWENLDDIHEKVNEIINNATFDKWPPETVKAELNKLYNIIQQTLDIFTGNYGAAPIRKQAGMKLYQ